MIVRIVGILLALLVYHVMLACALVAALEKTEMEYPELFANGKGVEHEQPD